YLHAVPPSLRNVAVLVEPLTIAEKALAQVRHVRERLGSRAGGRALVSGARPGGLLPAGGLAAPGPRSHGWSLAPGADARAALVDAVGARYVPAERESLAALGARLGNVDVLFEAAGAPPVTFQALDALGHNGVLVLFGLPGLPSPFEVDAASLVRTLVLKNQVVIGTINAGHADFMAAIRDLSAFEMRWPGVLRRLITHRVPLEAYADVLRPGAAGIKTVLVVT